jgi:hypothetical protein
VLSGILQDNPQDVASMRQYILTLKLLATVQQSINPGDVLNTLLSAYKMQKDIVLKVRSGATAVVTTGDVVEAERNTLSDICEQIGNCYVDLVEVLFFKIKIVYF